jgi:hypothetical protein
LPPPLSAQDAVALLNDQFAGGCAAECKQRRGDHSAAGLFVHQFENYDATPWLPCTADWCKPISDRLAVSVINAKQRSLYFGQGRGGVIYSARLSMHCVYPTDGDSQDKVCSTWGGGASSSMTHHGKAFDTHGAPCIPGCFPDGKWCGQPGADTLGACSYPPEQLCEALERQEEGFGRGRNNEIVMQVTELVDAPAKVVAGFFMTGRGDEVVRDAHHTFQSKYGSRVPLVRLNLGSDDPRPLTLA